MARCLLLLLGGLALAGCSGAASSEILDPVPSSSSTDPVTTGGTKAPGSQSSPARGETPKNANANGDTPPGATPPSPVPTDPSPTCMVEVEGNASADKATTFTSCIAGTVAGGKDNDFVRVIAPAGVKKMKVEHQEANGRLLYRVTEEEAFIPILGTTMFTEEEPEIRVTPGHGYVFQISAMMGDGRAERPWELTVTFDD